MSLTFVVLVAMGIACRGAVKLALIGLLLVVILITINNYFSQSTIWFAVTEIWQNDFQRRIIVSFMGFFVGCLAGKMFEPKN